MKTYHVLLIPALLIFAMSSPVMAADLETLSAYRVTTYNLGALLDNGETSNVNVRNFEPLMITSTKADILNNRLVGGYNLKTTPDINATRSFAIAAEYNHSAQFAVQGTFGMTRNSWEGSAFEQEASWEANLGLIYRLLDNLSYEIHFGYMETGDLFRERSSYSDVESIIMVSNKLTMSF